MAKAMAIKNGKGAGKRRSDNSGNKAKLKQAMKDGAASTKILMHNGLIFLLFAFAMLIAALLAIELGYTACGLIIGYTGGGTFETLADVVIVSVSILMVCGFIMFFTLKFQNWLIRSMKVRFWHKGAAAGEIVKRRPAGDADVKIYNGDIERIDSGKNDKKEKKNG